MSLITLIGSMIGVGCYFDAKLDNQYPVRLYVDCLNDRTFTLKEDAKFDNKYKIIAESCGKVLAAK